MGGAKNHAIVLPDADKDMAADAAVSAAYGSAGERCMAICVVVVVGEAADPLVTPRGAAAKIKVGRGAIGIRHGPADHLRGPRQGGLLPGERPAEGATLRWTAGSSPFQEGEGLLPGRLAVRQRQAGHGRYRNEIFGPVLSPCAARHMTKRCSHRRQPLRQRDGHLHPRRGRGAPVPVRDRRRPGGHQRADPGAGRVLQLRRLEGSLFGDLHMYGPEGVQFYTRAKVVTSRWPDPATGKVDLGFPAPAEPPSALGRASWPTCCPAPCCATCCW